MHHDPRVKPQAQLPKKWSSAQTVGDKVCLAVLACLYEGWQQEKPVLTKKEIHAVLSPLREGLELSSNDDALDQQIDLALNKGAKKLKKLGLVENDAESAAEKKYAFKMTLAGQDFMLGMTDSTVLLGTVSKGFSVLNEESSRPTPMLAQDRLVTRSASTENQLPFHTQRT